MVAAQGGECVKPMTERRVAAEKKRVMSALDLGSQAQPL